MLLPFLKSCLLCYFFKPMCYTNWVHICDLITLKRSLNKSLVWKFKGCMEKAIILSEFLLDFSIELNFIWDYNTFMLLS